MNETITRVVVHDNPWLEGRPLARWFARFLPPRYIPRRAVIHSDDRVCLVVGPRQVGKSTLIWKALSDLGKPVLYLNCEEPAIREWLTSPAAFLADLDTLVPPETALFFEEVQRLREAGLFLKGVADRRTGRRVYATGSSSFDLDASTRESLAGRATRTLLLPLSIEEVAGPAEDPPALRERRLSGATARLLLHGGYPAAVTASDPERVVSELVEAFVIRDASDRFRVQRPAAFRRLLDLAASQVGNRCNFSEWGALAGISNDTVNDYVRLLEETHVVRLLRPFLGGKRAEITLAPKVYFLDNGIRNVLFGGFAPPDRRPDRGALHDNLAFTEIWKSVNPLLDRVYYWRSKSGAEVDFVIGHRGRLLAIEVKSGGGRAGLSRSARSFIAAYSPEAFLVVVGEVPAAQGPSLPPSVGTTRVAAIRPWQVAAAVRDFLG